MLVIEERLTTSIFSPMGPRSRYPQLFQLEATPVYPATTADLERAIYDAIVEVARKGPTSAEVERVSNQIAAGAVRRIESNLGLAFQIAGSESLFGDWRETFRSSARLRRVTTGDVRRVAAQYLRVAKRTVAPLVTSDPSRHED